MKKRIVSVVLVLCLCVSSQSAAYASEDNSSQLEAVHAAENAEKPENGNDADTPPQESPAQSADVEKNAYTEEPENSDE